VAKARTRTRPCRRRRRPQDWPARTGVWSLGGPARQWPSNGARTVERCQLRCSLLRALNSLQLQPRCALSRSIEQLVLSSCMANQPLAHWVGCSWQQCKQRRGAAAAPQYHAPRRRARQHAAMNPMMRPIMSLRVARTGTGSLAACTRERRSLGRAPCCGRTQYEARVLAARSLVLRSPTARGPPERLHSLLYCTTPLSISDILRPGAQRNCARPTRALAVNHCEAVPVYW
jgi:hypothetical protein